MINYLGYALINLSRFGLQPACQWTVVLSEEVNKAKNLAITLIKAPKQVCSLIAR